MVKLTRIYTRTGDAGSTKLSDLSSTSKTDVRVAAYGDVDEANSLLGVALATGELAPELTAVLGHVQNELFDLGADLSNPLVTDPKWPALRITQECIDRLEGWCDEFSAGLPKLNSFILPGGTSAAAHLHLARTVVRRAERTAWQAIAAYGTEASSGDAPGGVNPLAVKYLNRLSDLLFILTRVVNGSAGDVLWVPGGDRATSPRESGHQRHQ